jgi:hypothetical protein
MPMLEISFDEEEEIILSEKDESMIESELKVP